MLASDGVTPIAGAQAIQIEVPDSGWPVHVKTTDADGRVDVEGLQALEVTVRAWPKQFASAESRSAARRTGGFPGDDVLVRVTTIMITPPETVATVILPKTAGY